MGNSHHLHYSVDYDGAAKKALKKDKIVCFKD
jgi:hypothetical protein